MKGRRSYIPYYYKPRSTKYSNETISFNCNLAAAVPPNTTFPENTGTDNPPGIMIVNPTNVFGNRKVKNFTVKITANGNEDVILGALVYIPEGTVASRIMAGGMSQSIYEPNQNVISTFVIPPNVKRDSDAAITQVSAPTTVTVSNKLARNLNTGDYIVIILCSPNGLRCGPGTQGTAEQVYISGTVNYAIKF